MDPLKATTRVLLTFGAFLGVLIWLVIKITKPTGFLKKEWTEGRLDAITVAVVVALLAVGGLAKWGAKRLAKKVEPTEIAKLEAENRHERAGIDWLRLCLLVIVWSFFAVMLTLGAFMILAFIAHLFFPESGFRDTFLVGGSGFAFFLIVIFGVFMIRRDSQRHPRPSLSQDGLRSSRRFSAEPAAKEDVEAQPEQAETILAIPAAPIDPHPVRVNAQPIAKVGAAQTNATAAIAMFRFICPACSKRLKAAADKVGRRAKCTFCGERLIIPETQEF
jgi:DNA-directed RNA polymerase subunit RPC12/RpoP